MRHCRMSAHAAIGCNVASVKGQIAASAAWIGVGIGKGLYSEANEGKNL
jgi:hypothetical protein